MSLSKKLTCEGSLLLRQIYIKVVLFSDILWMDTSWCVVFASTPSSPPTASSGQQPQLFLDAGIFFWGHYLNFYCQCSEMEFLNEIFSRGFWPLTRVFSDSSFCRFSTLIFPFYKMLFMNRHEFSCFAVFLRIFKAREEYGFL